MKLVKWVNCTEKEFEPYAGKGIDKVVKSLKSIDKIIIDDIIKNKYWFSGSDHQYLKGMPIIEYKGKEYFYFASFRYWGSLMAKAWNKIEGKNKYTYMDFYMCCHKDPNFKMPK